MIQKDTKMVEYFLKMELLLLNEIEKEKDCQSKKVPKEGKETKERNSMKEKRGKEILLFL